ncbi:GAF domain-containing sensor histidine kinase [Euzebya pacifica]|uniref:GAF domain-containing sensor histidine kinase n=1 Tax=Euzebya pacifica TaxID=1608957 RepID=UPI0030F65E59
MDAEAGLTAGGLSEGASGLAAVALALSSERDLDRVLFAVVAQACRVARSPYAAVALHDDRGVLTQFVQEGLEPEEVAAIGSCPVGGGLLGVVASATAPVRVDNIATDTRAAGFPEGHPAMRRLLGAPIVTPRRRYGSLYVCDRVDGMPFDDRDEGAIAVLARLSAAAIETASLLAAERERANAVAGEAAARARESAHRELLGQVIAAQEAERARVSRDLHDEIGQALTSVLLGLRITEDGLAAGTDGQQLRREHWAEVRSLVASALERVRNLAFELRPTVLDDIGLVPALNRLVSSIQQRTGIALELDVEGLGEADRLPPEVETVLYRVVQEALTNVVRHAEATVVGIQLVADDSRVRAVVEDDGRGFDHRAAEESLGLVGMRERASMTGGSLRVESAPGAGTVVVVEVPVG